MKKMTLFLSCLFLAATMAFAQKNKTPQQLKKQIIHTAKEKTNQKIKETSEKPLSPDAAFLLDSTRLVFFDDPDSLILQYSKYKYLPDGKVKETDLFFDAFFFALGFKTVSTWDIAKNRVLRNDIYVKTAIDDPYTFAGVDSLFYDAKGRNSLTKNYNVDGATSKISLSGWISNVYKTDNSLPDTIKTYELDGTDVIQTYLDFNGFDSKGNLIENYSLDLIDVGGAGERTTYKYDSKNNLIEELYSNEHQGTQWINTEFNLYKYNANNLVTEHYFYEQWDDVTKEWGDSTLTKTQYNSIKRPSVVENYKIDAQTSKWVIDQSTETSYDVNKNEIVDKIYAFDGTDKTLQGLNRYWWSFYKDAVGTKDLSQKGYDLTFANPISNGKMITVIAPQNQIMNLELFDMSGRLLSRQQVENNQSINLNISESGLLVAVLTDEKGKVLTLKRMIKL